MGRRPEEVHSESYASIRPSRSTFHSNSRAGAAFTLDTIRDGARAPAAAVPGAARAILCNTGIDPVALEGLAKTANAVSPAEDELLRLRLARAARKARDVSAHWDFAAPARIIDSFLGLEGDETVNPALRRAAVARLALEHFELSAPLPESVLALFPEHFARLSRFLTEGPVECYADDFYVKDVRYALGVTIPCGGLQMDLETRIGPKLIFRDAVASGSLRSLLSYASCDGWGRWGGNHIDLRAMKEFNLAGWTAAFVRMATILEMRPELRGIAGVSWFYDPALARTSPSLAHLHQIPLRHGAFLVRMTTTDDDVRNAIIRSPVRRALYEKGEYRPTRFLLAWPRAGLIAWARGVSAAGRRTLLVAPLACEHGKAVVR